MIARERGKMKELVNIFRLREGVVRKFVTQMNLDLVGYDINCRFGCNITAASKNVNQKKILSKFVSKTRTFRNIDKLEYFESPSTVDILSIFYQNEKLKLY